MVDTNGSGVVRASAAVVRSRGTHRHRPRLFVARGLLEVRVRVVPGRHLRDHVSARFVPTVPATRTRENLGPSGEAGAPIDVRFRLRARRVAVGSARERI